MNLSSNTKHKSRKALRLLIGLIAGAVAGFAASSVAGMAGSECTILCNQAIAIPYFAVVGLLIAWR